MFVKATAVFLTSALAASAGSPSQSATVIVEAASGGAGPGTNTTLTVPLNQDYTNSALNQVTSLYLIAAKGTSLESITCTPFKNSDGTGLDGHSFNSTVPAFLSTNTVRVGSIVCTTNSILQAPSVPGGPRSTQTSSSSSSSAASTTTKTYTLSSKDSSSTSTPALTTLTHTSSTSTGGGSPSSASTTTTSASPSQTSQSTNSGRSLFSSSEFFSGLAIAGLGIAYVL